MNFWRICKQFCAEVIQEGQKVVWPTGRDVVLTGIIVLVLAVIIAAFLGFVDNVVIIFLHVVLGVGNG